MNLYTPSGLQKNLQPSFLETIKILLPRTDQQLQCSIEICAEAGQGSRLLNLEKSQPGCRLDAGERNNPGQREEVGWQKEGTPKVKPYKVATDALQSNRVGFGRLTIIY